MVYLYNPIQTNVTAFRFGCNPNLGVLYTTEIKLKTVSLRDTVDRTSRKWLVSFTTVPLDVEVEVIFYPFVSQSKHEFPTPPIFS